MKIRLPLPLRTALLSSFLAVFSYTVQSATLSWYGENGGSFVENWWNPSPDTPDSPHRQDLLPHDNLVFGDQDPSSLEERTGLQEVIFGQKATYGSFTLTSALDWNIATAGSVFESVSVTAAGKTLTFDGLEVTDAMTATGNLVSTGNVKVGGDFTLGASSTLTGTNLDVSGALSNAGTITLSGGIDDAIVDTEFRRDYSGPIFQRRDGRQRHGCRRDEFVPGGEPVRQFIGHYRQRSFDSWSRYFGGRY